MLQAAPAYHGQNMMVLTKAGMQANSSGVPGLPVQPKYSPQPGRQFSVASTAASLASTPARTGASVSSWAGSFEYPPRSPSAQYGGYPSMPFGGSLNLPVGASAGLSPAGGSPHGQHAGNLEAQPRLPSSPYFSHSNAHFGGSLNLPVGASAGLSPPGSLALPVGGPLAKPTPFSVSGPGAAPRPAATVASTPEQGETKRVLAPQHMAEPGKHPRDLGMQDDGVSTACSSPQRLSTPKTESRESGGQQNSFRNVLQLMKAGTVGAAADGADRAEAAEKETVAFKDAAKRNSSMSPRPAAHPIKRAVAAAWQRMGLTRNEDEVKKYTKLLIDAGFEKRESLTLLTYDAAKKANIPVELAIALQSYHTRPSWMKSGSLPPVKESKDLNLWASTAAQLAATTAYPSINQTKAPSELRKHAKRGASISVAPLLGGFPTQLRDYEAPSRSPSHDGSVSARKSPVCALDGQLATRGEHVSAPRGTCFDRETENNFVAEKQFQARPWSRPRSRPPLSAREPQAFQHHVERQRCPVSRMGSSDMSPLGSPYQRRTFCLAGMELPQRIREQSREIAPTYIPDVHLERRPLSRAASHDLNHRSRHRSASAEQRTFKGEAVGQKGANSGAFTSRSSLRTIGPSGIESLPRWRNQHHQGYVQSMPGKIAPGEVLANVQKANAPTIVDGEQDGYFAQRLEVLQIENHRLRDILDIPKDHVIPDATSSMEGASYPETPPIMARTIAEAQRMPYSAATVGK